MPQNKRKIECFIPAIALEHPHNEEFYDLREKLCAALHRYQTTGNFLATSPVEEPMPYFFIERREFSREPLGYKIVAKC